MGRPTKKGIDYFPLDVGFFTDLKVRKVSRSCGSKSASILICLLCNIYRNNGYYLVWDKDMPFVIADEIGVSEEEVNEVVVKALQVGFFNNEIYEKCNILTSAGIQKRYILATYQRKERIFKEEYMVLSTRNKIICTNNSINCESVQIKENKSKKVDIKSKRKDKTSKAKSIDERKKEFYETLRPYLGKYPPEMLRKFYDYWSEMNRSGTKMKCELEDTWEVGKRLSTWANRDNSFKSSMEIGTVLHDNSTDKYQNEDKWNR